ncbi:hypothetical protein F5X68DRAFT_163646 [Plectosphaerella plurivora]|uniref:Zn(2)-C6 fungal-type domain-containing protein n=1 Tax=Plectosphaerella plurivora TaxID=936078 RepID=A0A9P9AHE9_9PEZI|nr:hypothetical protein F5X68DRAFT_163646 [Plectosphaerella plurivora]
MDKTKRPSVAAKDGLASKPPPLQQADQRREKTASAEAHKSPKKRRKVNHACVYCRRSHMTCDLERPCTRCIKRNIGHLCHDEPRDPEAKKPNKGPSTADDSESQSQSQSQSQPSSQPTAQAAQAPADMAPRSSVDQSPRSMGPPLAFDGRQNPKSQAFAANVLGQGNPLQLVSPTTVSSLQGNGLSAGSGGAGSGNMNQCKSCDTAETAARPALPGPAKHPCSFAGFSDAWLTAQNHYQDMQNYGQNYMIAPEVTHEFNLLHDFLQTSLLDDSALLGDDAQGNSAFNRSSRGQNDMLPGFNGAGNGVLQQQQHLQKHQSNNQAGSMLPPPNLEQGRAIERPGSVVQADKDKAREYYLQAADPSPVGNDTPEERMARVLRAKYDAGLLKPFNYVKGYVRLGKYLDSHIAAESKQKILRTIDRFRPKFREKAQTLTDMELVYVEMWFEKQLMEYDRVFASMAVPACCWRRTGEIFRGNKEMAELIHVPVENLRDGKVSINEILTEDSLVRYWEEFGTIAFDPAHDTLLTACTLKNPDDKATDPVLRCCFSFMIRRDEHKLPTLIVGNFLPTEPIKS